MNDLDYRLMGFLPTLGRTALLVDTSAGLSLGAYSKLEDFGSAVHPILSLVDVFSLQNLVGIANLQVLR